METNEVIRKAVGAIIFVVGGLIGGSSQVAGTWANKLPPLVGIALAIFVMSVGVAVWRSDKKEENLNENAVVPDEELNSDKEPSKEDLDNTKEEQLKVNDEVQVDISNQNSGIQLSSDIMQAKLDNHSTGLERKEVNKNKIIAKEFLILIATSLLIALFYVGLLVYNSLISKTNERIYQVNILKAAQLDSLANSNNIRRSISDPLYNLYNELLNKHLDVPETYESFRKTLLNDTINQIKYYSYLKDVGYVKTMTFEDFRRVYFFSSGEDSMEDDYQIKLSEIKKGMKTERRLVVVNDLIIKVIIIIISIVYPIRFLVLSTAWSLKTLKSK